MRYDIDGFTCEKSLNDLILSKAKLIISPCEMHAFWLFTYIMQFFISFGTVRLPDCSWYSLQPIFQRYPRPEKEYQSFSLIYDDRSLDLVSIPCAHSFSL